MSRLRRMVLSNHFFFITCRLARNRRALSGEEFACLARVLHVQRQKLRFLLTAWVFLPDHWHMVVMPLYPVTISDVMESTKVSSTRQINKQRGELGCLWQGRFFDRMLRTVKEYYEAVSYIHSNPVKAGLATSPEAWKWSSVRHYSGSLNKPVYPNGILSIDRFLLPADERARL